MELRRPGRLESSILIALSGFVVDWSTTQWLLGNFAWLKESNTHLIPELGIPLMVAAYVFGDLVLPRTRTHDIVIYTLSLMSWTGPFQNALVLLDVTPGINFLYALPFIGVCTFLTLYLFLPYRETGKLLKPLR